MKPALIFALVALAAVSVAEGFLIRRQEARLRELESAVAKQSTPEGAAEILKKAGVDPRAADAAVVSSTAAKAARQAVEDAVAEKAEEIARRLEALEKNALAAAGGGGGDPAAIDDMVSKKVDEKLADAKQKKGGLFGDDKKRPLSEISKDLALTELQEDQMAEAINASQKVCFGIVTTPRNDGTNILDDIVVAMQDPEHAQEKATAAFMKLFTDKIPGTDETYLARIMTEKGALNSEFKKVLTEDQMKKYTRLGQDPHEIQTGYDPYGEYLAERMGKK
ncbi:MAG: hypothetical protein FD180_3024 [Planctomycetota bacterium]|nr:MAG: hypothetical protein FD180_3024 [Planctomycetota bacterium]